MKNCWSDIKLLCTQGILNEKKQVDFWNGNFYHNLKPLPVASNEPRSPDNVDDRKDLMRFIPFDLMYTLIKEFKGPKGQILTGKSLAILNDKVS